MTILLSNNFVTPEDFGAVGDDPGDGTGTDDTEAFQAAINSSRRVYLPFAKTYRIHGQLLIPRFQQIIGLGLRSAISMFAGIEYGGARLVFTGSADACFKSQDETDMLSHGGLSGFVMRSIGSYGAMMSLKEMLDFHIKHVGMETDKVETSGLISRRIHTDNPSWMNSLYDVHIRLPDNSNRKSLDIEWSDSRVESSYFTGGYGAVDRGVGARFVNCQFERSRYAGLTILKSGNTPTKNTICSANSFDANCGHGILFDSLNDTSGTERFHVSVTGNNFRTQHPETGLPGFGSVGMVNTGSKTYSLGRFSGNVELVNGVPNFASVGSWASINSF